MKKTARILALLIVLIGPTHFLAAAAVDGSAVVKFTILQMNDVYEIVRPPDEPLGGLARVAAIRKRLLAENPATITVLSGDMLSPSPLNGVIVDGQPVAGRHMISVLNTAGLDLATFGNHEFDLTREQFHERLLESNFRWISSNVSDASGQPFPNVERTHVIRVKGENGLSARIGFIGLTITSNRVGFVSYADPIAAAAKQVEALRGQCDIVIAISTWRSLPTVCSPSRCREFTSLLGGTSTAQLRDSFPKGLLTSADRQGRCERTTVYIHRLRFDPVKRILEIRSQLYPVQGLPYSVPAVRRRGRRPCHQPARGPASRPGIQALRYRSGTIPTT